MYTIRMYSKADMAQGHGVLSAYEEQKSLVKRYLSDEFKVIERGNGKCTLNHFHTINPGFLIQAWKGKMRGTKNIGYVHFLPETLKNSIHLPRPIQWLFYKYVLFFYRNMDVLVTVNPYFVDVLEKKYHFQREKIKYIPNMVSSKNFFPLNPTPNGKRELRRHFHLQQNAFTVLCVGQLQQRKGVLDFIEIAKKMPEVQFVWAGDFSFGRISKDYDQIREAVAAPPANVIFLGLVKRSEMNYLYNACDIMMLPSYEELFPMTVLEAMQCEIPILVRDLELYDDILFNYVQYADSVEEFIMYIQKLAREKKFYKYCCECAALGADEYSEERVAGKWREYYISQIKQINLKNSMKS